MTKRRYGGSLRGDLGGIITVEACRLVSDHMHLEKGSMEERPSGRVLKGPWVLVSLEGLRQRAGQVRLFVSGMGWIKCW